MKRRGSTLPTIEVSGHAIDSASLRCRRTWHETAKNAEEGLHAWLLRMAAEAWAAGEGAEVIEYAGIRWVFAPGEEWPVLKTVTLG